MSNFILTGFADEIADSLDAQIAGLRQNGIAHIEVRGVDGRNISTYTPDEAQIIRQKLDAGGIAVSALGSPVGKIGLDDADAFEAHVAMFQTMLRVADVLGTRTMRMFSFFIPDGDAPERHRDEVLRRLERLLNLSAGSGITLAHENERHIYGENTACCVDIMQHFGGAMRFVFDPANFVVSGVKPREAFPVLRKYIDYVHIKDAKLGVFRAETGERDMGFQNVSSEVLPAGKGDGDIAWVLQQLQNDGYEGFLSIEPHLVNNPDYPGDGLAKFTAASDHLKAVLAGIA